MEQEFHSGFVSYSISCQMHTMHWLSSHHSMESRWCFCKRTVLVPLQGAIGLMGTVKSELSPLASLWSWLWEFHPFIHGLEAVLYLEVHINLCSWVTRAGKTAWGYSVQLPKMCLNLPRAISPPLTSDSSFAFNNGSQTSRGFTNSLMKELLTLKKMNLHPFNISLPLRYQWC